MQILGQKFGVYQGILIWSGQYPLAPTADAWLANKGPLYPPPDLLPRLCQKDAAIDETNPDCPSPPPPTDTTPADTSESSQTEPLEEKTGIPNAHPESLTESQAVAIAYAPYIKKIASFLRSQLSVLISCEKLVAPYLWRQIMKQAWAPAEVGSLKEIKLQAVLLELPSDEPNANPLAGNNRLNQLRTIIKELKPGQVLVVPNLDLIGSGGEKNLNRESRELTEMIYDALDRLVLAFVDPSLPVPEVIASRFAVRMEVEGLDREVMGDHDTPVSIAKALVSSKEAAMFDGFNPDDFYKNIAGLSPIRLRQAMAYAVQMARDEGHHPDNKASVDFLQDNIRAFKAQTTDQFDVPNVTFDDIGGYHEVKALLCKAIALMSGQGELPDEKLRNELISRGFLFHGPPGTGKTLFAKAIANQLNATVRVVSGPEVTDMYVGESERKVRAIFAEARRNAPSVVVFDEFDAIAARRSGRDDGGSRAGNALVAQILTEMDGFRPDVPMLVIGTTNRLGLIDEALLRPSRFQPVAIGLPDIEARFHIAKIHASHFKIEVSEDLLHIIAEATQGMNGDEIRALFRDACVGHYFETPKKEASPWQLGFLVGRIRTRLDAVIQTPKYTAQPQPGERRRPGPGMQTLTRQSTTQEPPDQRIRENSYMQPETRQSTTQSLPGQKRLPGSDMQPLARQNSNEG
jgi:transitional endoplasmic reticulum ATPase